MQYLFLLSAIYNFLAASILWVKSPILLDDTPEKFQDPTQFRMFTGGTASIFGILDCYLFLSADLAQSLHSLVTLAVLIKLWSFVTIGLILKVNHHPIEDFIPMALVNGIFMILFIGFLT
jgi:hypothetical protein